MAKGSVRAPQGAHDQYEDEQLATIQKWICLIEFLFMVGLLFVKEESPRPENLNRPSGRF